MSNVISIVQLPFPGLDYFPVPEYFPSLQIWYKKNISESCNIPDKGIWEIPLWIAWVKAFIQMALDDIEIKSKIEIIDLNKIDYSFEEVCRHLDRGDTSDIYFFSPLIQNYLLTEKVAIYLKEKGAKTMVGGAIASYININKSPFDYIFEGKIESNYLSFVSIIAEVFSSQSSFFSFTYKKFASYLTYDWAINYSNEIIFLRTYSYHGCPLSCLFCADRLSGSQLIPDEVIEREILELYKIFPSSDTIFIGDLTFGINKEALLALERVLSKIKTEINKSYKIIVQTNPSLINQSFIDYCKRINVVLIELGIESGNSVSVNRIEKKRPSTDWLEKKIELIINNNLLVSGNIIVGLPDDIEEDYLITVDFIKKWKSKIWFNVYGFVPYPNTPLFQKLKENKRIVDWNYDNWCEGKKIVFEPFFISRATVQIYLEKIIRCAIS